MGQEYMGCLFFDSRCIYAAQLSKRNDHSQARSPQVKNACRSHFLVLFRFVEAPLTINQRGTIA